ncbi:MAG: hypothetical protein R2713_06565 [Ilumatobacteraceae bacterium]
MPLGNDAAVEEACSTDGATLIDTIRNLAVKVTTGETDYAGGGTLARRHHPHRHRRRTGHRRPGSSSVVAGG